MLPEGSSAQWGVTLVGSSPSQQDAETEEGGAEGEEQVIELGQSEDEFGVFDQFDPSEDPSSDLGDPSLTEAYLQGTSLQAEMGFKRKPSTSLLDLIEGQPGKAALGKSQPKLPLPRPSPNPPRPGHRPPYRSHPNFPLLFSPPTQKGKGMPKGKKLRIGGDLVLFRRRTRPDGLQSN